MKIVEFDIKNVPINDKEISLCLGYFDGVHLGHQAIIKESMNEGYPVGVLSFDNSPSYILGQKGNYELTSIADKADIFEELGVKYLFIMHFDKSTLNVTKDEKTILDYLTKVVHATSGDIVIGTGLSKDKVLRLIKNLINNGYVNVSGVGKATKYSI